MVQVLLAFAQSGQMGTFALHGGTGAPLTSSSDDESESDDSPSPCFRSFFAFFSFFSFLAAPPLGLSLASRACAAAAAAAAAAASAAATALSSAARRTKHDLMSDLCEVTNGVEHQRLDWQTQDRQTNQTRRTRPGTHLDPCR